MYRRSTWKEPHSLRRRKKFKREQEIHSIRICEVMEQKNKYEHEKFMVEEDKRLLNTRLEEKDN